MCYQGLRRRALVSPPRWVACLIAPLAALSSAAPATASVVSYAGTLPALTTSYYEQTGSSPVMYRQGEVAGKEGAQGIIILDFGRPAAIGTTYGTMGFGGSFISLPEIVTGVEGFIRAYFHYAPADMTLDVAVGTNDSCGTGQPCGTRICGCNNEPVSFYAYGGAWALAVEELRSWALDLKAAGGYTDTVRVVAADDAEPAYDPGYRNTYELLAGYAATVGGSEPAMVDYGSAERSWTEEELLQVAYGFRPDVPMPQVYYSSQAGEWANLLSYAKRARHLNMTIFGVLAGADPAAAYGEMLSAAERVTQQHAIPWLSTLTS